jgi:hypothetical protein
MTEVADRLTHTDGETAVKWDLANYYASNTEP